MPTSNFRRRAEVFAWFDRNWPDDFDLWGRGWNRPMGPVQRWFGHRTYRTYRGEVPDDVDGKILAMARYKFYLCLENNIHESGFVTDRITDALCARTVPVYHGPTTMGDHVPPECFINYREFAGPADLGRFLRSIDEARYRRYLDAGQAFLESNATRFFTTYYMFRVIHDRLLAPAGRL
jgi:hypothetical protein